MAASANGFTSLCEELKSLTWKEVVNLDCVVQQYKLPQILQVLDENSIPQSVDKITRGDFLLLHSPWNVQKVVCQSVEGEGHYVVGNRLEIPYGYEGKFEIFNLWEQDYKVFNSVEEVARVFPTRVFALEDINITMVAVVSENSDDRECFKIVIKAGQELTLMGQTDLYLEEWPDRSKMGIFGKGKSLVSKIRPKIKKTPCLICMHHTQAESVKLPYPCKGRFSTSSPAEIRQYEGAHTVQEIADNVRLPVSVKLVQPPAHNAHDEYRIQKKASLKFLQKEEGQDVIAACGLKEGARKLFQVDARLKPVFRIADQAKQKTEQYQTLLRECMQLWTDHDVDAYFRAVRIHRSRKQRNSRDLSNQSSVDREECPVPPPRRTSRHIGRPQVEDSPRSKVLSKALPPTPREEGQDHPDGHEIPYDFLWPGTGRIDTSNRDSSGSTEEQPQFVDRKELDNALHVTADEEPSDFEYLEDWEDWSEMDNRHRNGEGNNNKAVANSRFSQASNRERNRNDKGVTESNTLNSLVSSDESQAYELLVDIGKSKSLPWDTRTPLSPTNADLGDIPPRPPRNPTATPPPLPLSPRPSMTSLSDSQKSGQTSPQQVRSGQRSPVEGPPILPRGMPPTHSSVSSLSDSDPPPLPPPRLPPRPMTSRAKSENRSESPSDFEDMDSLSIDGSQESDSDKRSPRVNSSPFVTDPDWIPPDNLSNLTVQEVSQCLRYIGTPDNVVQQFFRERIDGQMLIQLDKDILSQEFRLSGLQTKKISEFINGWRPRL
ncbi:GRB2-associated and regulator of MAPK protein 1-like [Branchiostoma lanceolatum]|uniref:GAREM1 protein n=1 Tax=Branchiostoma lanceolatum TaxID=7740 RepID=A0A8J9ZGK1_BRALA|nr:GAREM1 [Branchiostoma lanceolatum]